VTVEGWPPDLDRRRSSSDGLAEPPGTGRQITPKFPLRQATQPLDGRGFLGEIYLWQKSHIGKEIWFMSCKIPFASFLILPERILPVVMDRDAGRILSGL
jgi:hypothetical protein